MKTYLQKRIKDIKEARLGKKRERAYIAQLKRSGYSDMDVWGLNTHLARYMLPMLKKLFKKPHGHPCDITYEQWLDIGKKIVWTIERFALDDVYELARKKTGFHTSYKKIRFINEDGKPYARMEFPADDEKLRKAWLKEIRRLSNEMDKGMKLFGKYFGNLWD